MLLINCKIHHPKLRVCSPLIQKRISLLNIWILSDLEGNERLMFDGDTADSHRYFTCAIDIDHNTFITPEHIWNNI